MKKILVFPEDENRWSWLLHGDDGEHLAVSGRTFLTYAKAMSDAQAAVGCLGEAVIQVDNGYISIPRPDHLAVSKPAF